MDRLRSGLALLLVLLAACSSGVEEGASTSTTAPARVAPPVIREVFTLLPCDEADDSQIGMEGCIEHEIVRVDHEIDALAALVFRDFYSDGARRRFLAAEAAWLRYRHLTCDSRGDVNEGGTEAALVSGACQQEVSEAHLADLQQLHAAFLEP